MSSMMIVPLHIFVIPYKHVIQYLIYEGLATVLDTYRNIQLIPIVF